MQILTYCLMFLAGANAFAPTGRSSLSRESAPLSAMQQSDDNSKKASIGATIAGFALGWTLVSSSAFAVDLDFSLPSYDAKMSGFGSGTEAVLNSKTNSLTDPGVNEKSKQETAAIKAALALKEKRTKEQEMKKLQYAADEQKAVERKARDAERMKNIWN
jgi:hypothetical protein